MRILVCLRLAFVTAALTFSCNMGASAQSQQNEQTKPELEKAFEQAFQAVLADPGNLDKSFRYAQLAIKLRDFEAAISAMERMLILNPSLARVRLELGVLYFRLGSFAIAKSYLLSATQGEDVPPLVRERVGVFLAEIDKRLSQHRVMGSMTAGSRFQTNANAGPASTTIQLFGELRDALPSDSTGQGDFNGFGALSLRHIYDLETQDGTTFNTEFLLFGSKQIDQEQVDVIFAELVSGPRFRLPEDWIPGAAVRPFARLSGVYLGDAFLSGSYGGGLELTKQVTDRLGLTLSYDLEYKIFDNITDRPSASDENGLEHEAELTMLLGITPSISGVGRVRIKDQNARTGIEANRQLGGLVGFSVTYEAPLGMSARRWLSSFNVEYAITAYDSPEAAIDPTIRRRDERVDFRLRTNVPVSRRFSLAVSATYTKVTSSLPNFEFDNHAVALSGTYSF